MTLISTNLTHQEFIHADPQQHDRWLLVKVHHRLWTRTRRTASNLSGCWKIFPTGWGTLLGHPGTCRRELFTLQPCNHQLVNSLLFDFAFMTFCGIPSLPSLGRLAPPGSSPLPHRFGRWPQRHWLHSAWAWRSCAGGAWCIRHPSGLGRCSGLDWPGRLKRSVGFAKTA